MKTALRILELFVVYLTVTTLAEPYWTTGQWELVAMLFALLLYILVVGVAAGREWERRR